MTNRYGLSLLALSAVLATVGFGRLHTSASRPAASASAAMRRQLFLSTLSPRAENAPSLSVLLALDPASANSLKRRWSEVKLQVEGGNIAPLKVPPPSLSAAELEDVFVTLRDDRFIQDFAREGKRRLTWFFPDDGCYVRADAGVRHLRFLKKPVPTKIFAFGRANAQLTAKTTHHPKGSVKWWYHVAPTVQVAGQVFVLDPAIEASRPLPVEEWLGRMSPNPEGVEVSFCTTETYSPSTPCVGNDVNPVKEAEFATVNYSLIGFLEREWHRVTELGWDPIDVLGKDDAFQRSEKEYAPLPVVTPQ